MKCRKICKNIEKFTLSIFWYTKVTKVTKVTLFPSNFAQVSAKIKGSRKKWWVQKLTGAGA